jgi:hypothetical protein
MSNGSAYRVLGEGAFGFVVSPACPCTDNAALNALDPVAYVSKIFMAPAKGIDDAVVEWEHYQQLRAVDTAGAFITHCAGIGTPHVAALPRAIRRQLRKFGVTGQQLLYAHGGQTLEWHADRQDIGLRALLVQLTSVVDGLVALAAAGILHLDLKPANIVLKDGCAKLIDFGFVSTAASLAADDQHEVWSYGYEYWPPELDFLYKVTTGRKPSWKDHGSNRYGDARGTAAFSRLSHLFPNFSKRKYDDDYVAMCERLRKEVGLVADETDWDADSFGSLDSDEEAGDFDSDETDTDADSKADGGDGSDSDVDSKSGDADVDSKSGDESDETDVDGTDGDVPRSADVAPAPPAAAAAAKAYILHQLMPTADMYALGLAVAVTWRTYDRAEASDLSTRETKQLTRWVRNVTHVNGFQRWQPAEAGRQWRSLWRLPAK